MPPRDPKPANSRRKVQVKAQSRRTGTSTHRDAGEVLRPTPARFRSASHPNQGQLAQALPQLAAERSPKARNAWLPAKPATGRNRMAAGHVRRRHRTQGHPKDVGLYWPADQQAAANRPGRRQWTIPDGHHHQKPRRRADQGILARPKRGTHAPAVRWRLPGQLPRRPSRTAMYRSTRTRSTPSS